MVRDPEATKRRILDAATAEFAAWGLAGARVDRLADAAGANKERIYAYFGNKEGLFDATVEANIESLIDAVPFTADDIPGYAERMLEFDVAHPELRRLALWHTLERPGLLDQLPQAASSTARKLAAIADAQAAGIVDDSLPPEQLLELVLSVIHAGILGPPPENRAAQADRTRVLRLAVGRLVTPAADA